jgi:hypothetical protein
MMSPFQEPTIAEAPYIGSGKPGRRKVGYAIEDTVWATFHRTDAATVEEAEAGLVVLTGTIKEVLHKKGVSL